MKSTASKRSARFDLRIDPDLKKQFIKYCKNNQVIVSKTAREALQQFISLGEFKKSLFEYLHEHHPARKKFNEFLNEIHTQAPLSKWLDELLGSEEEALIKSTPAILLPNIRNIILTNYGKQIFEKRINNNN